MGWREIRGYTEKAISRIDRDTAEKSSKMSEITNILGQGASLYSKWATGKAEHKALEEFGTSEGLTYDKSTKSFYGTKVGDPTGEIHPKFLKKYQEAFDKGQISQEKFDELVKNPIVSAQNLEQLHYKISSAELKTMQDFQKYTDKSISDFISKDGVIKKGYSTDLSELDPSIAGDIRSGETMDVTMKNLQDEMQTVAGGGRTKRKVPAFIQHKRRIAEQDIKHSGDLSAALKNYQFGAGVKTDYDVQAEISKIHEENIASSIARDTELEKRLVIQREKQAEFDIKVESDKKSEEEERIRQEEAQEAERIKQEEEKIRILNETSRYINPDLKEKKPVGWRSVLFDEQRK